MWLLSAAPVFAYPVTLYLSILPQQEEAVEQPVPILVVIETLTDEEYLHVNLPEYVDEAILQYLIASDITTDIIKSVSVY